MCIEKKKNQRKKINGKEGSAEMKWKSEKYVTSLETLDKKG